METVDEDDEDDQNFMDKDAVHKKVFDFLKTDNPTVERRLEPDEMLERSFLMPPGEDGSRVRAKIMERVNEHMEGTENDTDFIKLKCLVDDQFEEVVAHNDIIDYIEQDVISPVSHKILRLHRDPLCLGLFGLTGPS